MKDDNGVDEENVIRFLQDFVGELVSRNIVVEKVSYDIHTVPAIYEGITLDYIEWNRTLSITFRKRR